MKIALRVAAFVLAAYVSLTAQDTARATGDPQPNSLAAVICPKAQRNLEAGHQTQVTIHMTISEKGSVESFYFVSPSGMHLEKGQEVKKTVKAMMFKPAKKDGHPVAVQIALAVDCSSKDAPSQPAQGH